MSKGFRSPRFEAILFDFDGVMIESEWAGNKQIADFLTGAGHPTSVAESMEQFMGLSGPDFRAAIERWIGGPLPGGFDEARAMADKQMIEAGIAEVEGACAFVRSLDPRWPKAIVSSSSMDWIRAHLDHLDLFERFAPHIYSGKTHVTRGKPAPDLYLYAARRLGVAIERCVIIEDSPVGATGAVASGAHVIGLVAGEHCAPGHGEKLRAIGVHDIARNFDEVRDLLS